MKLRGFDDANTGVGSTRFGLCPSPNSCTAKSSIAALRESARQRIAWGRNISGRQFSEPQRLIERSQGLELSLQVRIAIAFATRIVMSLIKIEVKLAPGANPH